MALLACAVFKYQRGVLLALTLYSAYMMLHSVHLTVFSTRGLFLLWKNSCCDWYEMHGERLRQEALCRKENELLQSGDYDDEDENEEDGLQWSDVIHVVMIPTYNTPQKVLVASLEALEHFSLARTNLGVCLAMEEREVGAASKVQALRKEFEGRFRFITATYHPTGIPHHVPGKSSNECWAFSQLQIELRDVHGLPSDSPEVIVTVIDDDSELHSKYFDALTYHYLKELPVKRHLTIWQPPIVHFKNYLRQPVLVRTAATITALHELGCLANPMDCHVPFSSYSLSLALASAVGGWDPDYISEDWHMMAKCSLMTEGRVRCEPIYLPLMNYTPEEDTWIRTMQSRWTQATRHALGMSEIVYLGSSIYLLVLEAPSARRALMGIKRLLPLLGKFFTVHFILATLAIWPIMAHLLIHSSMQTSWCDIQSLQETCPTCCISTRHSDNLALNNQQVFLNSWMVYAQQKASIVLVVLLLYTGGLGAFLFRLVKNRVEGEADSSCAHKSAVLLWARVELECISCGWMTSIVFGLIPEWIAAVRILQTLKFNHIVAGMVGRQEGIADV